MIFSLIDRQIKLSLIRWRPNLGYNFIKRLWLKCSGWRVMRRPFRLQAQSALRLSHVVSTKGQKGQKGRKGTLSPGLSGYAPRLFISLRFHVLRTTTPIRFGRLSPGVSGYALNPRLFMRFLLLRMSPSIPGLTMSNRRIKLTSAVVPKLKNEVRKI